MTTAAVAPSSGHRIQVLLGRHAFIDHIEPDPDKAAFYEAAMRRQFASCRVTNTPYSGPPPDETAADGPFRP